MEEAKRLEDLEKESQNTEGRRDKNKIEAVESKDLLLAMGSQEDQLEQTQELGDKTLRNIEREFAKEVGSDEEPEQRVLNM